MSTSNVKEAIRKKRRHPAPSGKRFKFVANYDTLRHKNRQKRIEEGKISADSKRRTAVARRRANYYLQNNSGILAIKQSRLAAKVRQTANTIAEQLSDLDDHDFGLKVSKMAPSNGLKQPVMQISKEALGSLTLVIEQYANDVLTTANVLRVHRGGEHQVNAKDVTVAAQMCSGKTLL